MPLESVDSKSAYAERKQFIDLVHRFEAEAKASPARYEARCRSMVRIGYLYLGFVLTLLVGVLAGMIYLMVSADRIHGGVIKLVLIVGIPILAIIAALFKRIPDEKDGIDVSRQEAPRLWAEVDQLQQALKAPKIHVIRITQDWNASASQIPAFGMLGPCKNTLRYGLPLMAAETPDEMRTTVAHELGHFAGDHSRFSGSVYRVFETWQVASEQLNTVSGIILKPFLNWYLPKLWATTFPLRRQAEYTADQAATRLIGAMPNALSLVRLGTQSANIGETYREIYEQAEVTPTPHNSAVSELVKTAKAGLEPEKFDEYLAKALAEETTYDDSHPSLSDRLAAVDPGIDAASFRDVVCRPTKPSAADQFLGEALGHSLEQRLNRHWADSVREGWEMRHCQVAAGAASLRSVDREDLSSMPMPTLAKHLTTSLNVRGWEASEKFALAILEKDPNHGEANLVLANKYFDSDPVKAKEHLELASKDRLTRAAAYGALSALAEKQGNQIEAAKYYDLSAQGQQDEEAYDQEARASGPNTLAGTWSPDPIDLGVARQFFDTSRDIEKVYAAKFESRLRPGTYHEMLVVCPDYPRFLSDEEVFVRKVLEDIQFVPIQCRIVVRSEKALRKAVEGLPPEALVWAAPAKK